MMNTEQGDIQVSVCCLVYNHEKYLRQCLDGFVMQKTDFRFEVLIHDDASTDQSADIIKEYEERYPNIIKPIYQKENKYSKGEKVNLKYNVLRARGKYVALCEGDDYWIDEFKLQKQYDAMESNPSAVMCVHTVREVYTNGEPTGREYPSQPIDKTLINSETMMDIMVQFNQYPFQTSSYFYKTELGKQYAENLPMFAQVSKTGDVPLMLYMISCGDYVVIHDVMSCYRVGVEGSWNSCNRRTLDMQRVVCNAGIASLKLFDNDTRGVYSAQIAELVDRQDYFLSQLTKNYQRLCSNHLKKFRRNESKKVRAYYFLRATCDCLIQIYEKLKNKRQGRDIK